MTIEELRAKLRQVNADAEAILNDADENADGELSEEQSTKLDALFAEHDKLKADLDRRERLAKQRADMDSSNGRITQPGTPRIEEIGPNNPDADTTAGFGNLADFARSVHQACAPGGVRDDRLNAMIDIQGAPTNFHQEAGGSEGYMVPPAFRQAIWEMVFGEDDLLSMVDLEPTISNAVELVTDETTPWGSSGVQAKWRAEGQQMTPSKLATNGETVKLNELYAFVLATDELLQDAPRLNARLTRKAAEAIRWKASESIINGTGVGQPKGYFNSAAKVTVAKTSGQAAATVTTRNVSNMFSRLLPQGLSRAVWLANSDVLPQLIELVIGQQPIWTPPNAGLQQAPGGFILGRPVIFTEHANTLGTEGDLQFIDPMGYYAANKAGGIDFASSIHLYFDYGMQAFRWTFRFGGQPYLSAPVSPAKGSNTKSHFVTLATRA